MNKYQVTDKYGATKEYDAVSFFIYPNGLVQLDVAPEHRIILRDVMEIKKVEVKS